MSSATTASAGITDRQGLLDAQPQEDSRLIGQVYRKSLVLSLSPRRQRPGPASPAILLFYPGSLSS